MAGPLPRELSILKDLKRFIAPGNKLQGNLEDPFRGLSLLDTVVLSKNQIIGTIPDVLLEQNPNLGKLEQSRGAIITFFFVP